MSLLSLRVGVVFLSLSAGVSAAIVACGSADQADADGSGDAGKDASTRPFDSTTPIVPNTDDDASENDAATSGDGATDASLDSGPIDSGVTCLPAACTSPSKPPSLLCIDFDNLDAGMPGFFTGGPPGGYVPSRPMCGEAHSQAGWANGMSLALADGTKDRIEFDLYVEKDSMIASGPVTCAYVAGPAGNANPMIQVALEATAANAVGLKVRNIAGVAEGGSVSFLTSTWAHAVIELTSTNVSVRVNGGTPLITSLTGASGTATPQFALSGVGGSITKLYIDNVVVDTNPM